MIDAFKIIAMAESQAAADGFKEYFDKLNLKPDIKEKMQAFKPWHPLYNNGFHPALILHMIEYNNSQ